MKIILQSTWSRLSDAPVTFNCPWKLVTHQLETYKALHDDGVSVVFDTAMTGDGKSLAGYLPLLRPGSPRLGNGLFAYPTNELIRDQARQANQYLEEFMSVLRLQQLNGDIISQYAAVNETTRYSSILDLISHKNVILTNPDVFHLIESFRYVSPLQNPATLAQQLINRFRYVVFDEFHIFGAPQVASVIDAMLFIRANQSPDFPVKYLFLSATPHEMLQDLLDRAGFSYRVISGEYIHGDYSGKEYRQILQSSSLDLVALEPDGILGWIERKIGWLKDFYYTYPDTKGAIICNSVFTAKRVVALLKERLEPEISIGENTGLTAPEIRKHSFDTQLVVATSTVDVGVDFRLNLLIFESPDAGSFIQRLGRLGRHRGFPHYHGVALLQPFIAERFEQHYEDGQAENREHFFSIVKSEIFRKHNRFEEYLPRWGGVCATQRLYQLHAPEVKAKYTTLIENYKPSAINVFRISKATKERTHSLSSAVNWELRAFRGAGLLDVWAYDAASGHINLISLLRVISGTDFALISSKEAESLAVILEQPFRKPQMGLYVKMYGYLDERTRYNLCYRGCLSDNLTPINQATERLGFYLVDFPHPQVGAINKSLEQMPLCTCVASPDLDVATLRRRFALPPLFQLFSVIDDTGANYPVAFGQDALLLDSILHWRQTNETYIV